MMRNYNPRRINVSVVGDGFYLTQEEDGEVLYVPSPAQYTDIHAWTLDLDDTQLEAACQIYWDRWAFQSDDPDDRMAFDAAVTERSRRCLEHSTFAAGIFG